MAITLMTHGQMLEVSDGVTCTYYPANGIEISYNTADEVLLFTAYDGGNTRQRILRTPYTNIWIAGATPNPVQFATAEETAENIAKITGTATVDVAIQDQTTDIIIQPFMNRRNGTTLAISSTLYDKSVTVTSATGMLVGDRFVIFDPVAIRFSGFFIVGISGNIITLDAPIDFAYTAGSFIDFGSINMAVNGSVTPVKFGVRNPQGTPPDVSLSFDVTRIIVACLTDTAVDLNKFGDLAPLTNGLLLRYNDGRTYNIFNVKRNGGFAAIGYDWQPHASTNPTQGQDGFIFRLTFGGQEKLGVVSRLDIGTDLEIIVQDDLLLLDELTVVAEGHLVQETT
jgi:hypothetical protein